MGSKNKSLNLDKDFLYDLYWNKNLSTVEIAKELDCTSTCVRNWMKRFDIPRRTDSESIKISAPKRTEECLKNRAKKFRDTWYSRPIEEREKINKSRATKPENIESSVVKARETKSKNQSGTKSKSEDLFYHTLCTIFDSSDIVRQYSDDRYPFNCDFYIKSKDLFIEYQGHFSHYIEPFDKNNIEHEKVLKESKIDLTTWSKRDPKKLETALVNNINLILVYPKHNIYFYHDNEIETIQINDLYEI